MKLPLTLGAYQARSYSAEAQRCVNLYAEPNPEDAPFPFTMYPTPGLNRVFNQDDYGPQGVIEHTPDGDTTGLLYGGNARCVYTSSLGGLYSVIGQNVYYHQPLAGTTFGLDGTVLGQIASVGSPVYMYDNGIQILIVDGGVEKYTINISPDAKDDAGDPIPFNQFDVTVDDAYYGSSRIAFLDGFFILNRPNTREFYVSNFLTTKFDGLDFASKLSDNDLLVGGEVIKQVLFLFGSKTTEIWYNSGDLFPLARMQGAIIQHGCEDADSIQRADDAILWLSKNDQGNRIVLQSVGYDAKRISTFAMEQEISRYPDPVGCTAWTYQSGGHTFYVMTFASGNKTWVYDLSTGQWHEWAYMPEPGRLTRHRGNCHAFYKGRHIVGDYEKGYLYELTPSASRDDGREILRLRSFPHVEQDGNRITYSRFQLNAKDYTEKPVRWNYAPEPEPPATPLTNMIVFGTDGGSSPVIYPYSVDEESKVFTLLPSPTAPDGFCQYSGDISPDGTIVIYPWFASPVVGGASVYARTGSQGSLELTKLSGMPITDACYATKFSPDGNYLVLATGYNGGTFSRPRVFSVSGSGTGVSFTLLGTQPADTGFIGYWAFSPDGNYLVGTYGTEIYLYTFAAGILTPVSVPGIGALTYQAAFNSTSDILIVGGNGFIKAYSLSGATATPLTFASSPIEGNLGVSITKTGAILVNANSTGTGEQSSWFINGTAFDVLQSTINPGAALTYNYLNFNQDALLSITQAGQVSVIDVTGTAADTLISTSATTWGPVPGVTGAKSLMLLTVPES